MIKQISVFLENKSGRLVRVARVLGEAGINIRGVFNSRYFRFRDPAFDRGSARQGPGNS